MFARDVVDAVNAAGLVERNVIKRTVEENCLWEGMSRTETKQRSPKR